MEATSTVNAYQEILKKTQELKKYARSKGWLVVFKNHTSAQGDFSFFLYNKSIKEKGYVIGFDGAYNSCHGYSLTCEKHPELSFVRQLQNSYDFIDGKYTA